MPEQKILRSACRSCSAGCAVLMHVEDDRVTKVEGMPGFLTNDGALCPRAVAAPRVLYAPDRILHPMKRVGRRGEGRWEKISWDEALDTIGQRLNEVKEKYGARAYFHFFGQQWHWVPTSVMNARFCFAFGSPNSAMHMDQCFGPPSLAQSITYGLPYINRFTFPGALDYEDHPTKCMMFWGSNPFTSRSNRARRILDAKEKGAKIIAVDPYFSSIAQKADLWLQLKPGTDVALALAMMNVIIKEGLYDKDFVEKWTHGFDKLAAHVEDYPPERVEKISWVPKEKIILAARMYATNRPGQMEDYLGVSHIYDGFDAHRCCAILRAITGNFDVKGGDVWFPLTPYFMRLSESSLFPTLKEKAVSWEKCELMTELAGKLYMTPALSSQLTEAILHERPYPLRAAMIIGANPISTAGPNRRDWEEALGSTDKLEFVAVCDLFMTATARYADIFLPGTWWPETPELSEHVPMANYVLLREPAKPAGECRPVFDILLDLAGRMGMGALFPWKDIYEMIDDVYKPLSVEELRKHPTGMFVPGCETPKNLRYRKYEAQGFNTPSGKIEIYSKRLEETGADPLPVYHDYTEVLSRETGLSASDLEAEYPLLLSKHNTYVYAHSQFRTVGLHREIEPGPEVEIHPKTAAQYDIKGGDRVRIESPFGAVEALANLTERTHPRMVFMLHGWDEGGASDTSFLQARSSRTPVLGISASNGVRVRVRRA
jgi:formate dehydrogenase (coenzyme F420) alpha subunit